MVVLCVLFSEDVKKRIIDAVLDKQVIDYFGICLRGLSLFFVFLFLLLVSQMGFDLVGHFIEKR